MKVKIGVGDKELVSQGILHLRSDDSITIELVDHDLTMIFSFEENKSVIGSQYTGVGNGNKYNITLSNFNNPFGEGVVTPVAIGQVEGRELYMSFFIYTLKNNERRFEYNLFLAN